jgi:hypothetical protein
MRHLRRNLYLNLPSTHSLWTDQILICCQSLVFAELTLKTEFMVEIE